MTVQIFFNDDCISVFLWVDGNLLLRNLNEAVILKEKISKAFVLSCECCFSFNIDNNLYLKCLKLLPDVLDEADKYKLCKWMRECLNEYLRYAERIVDLEYHYFEYEANKRSQKEMIDLLMESDV